MSDGLALASMLGAVPGIEQTAVDGYESIVVVGFKEAVAVTVDILNGRVIGDGYVVWSNAHQLAVFIVGIVNSEEAFALAGLEGEPDIGEPSSVRGSWDRAQV